MGAVGGVEARSRVPKCEGLHRLDRGGEKGHRQADRTRKLSHVGSPIPLKLPRRSDLGPVARHTSLQLHLGTLNNPCRRSSSATYDICYVSMHMIKPCDGVQSHQPFATDGRLTRRACIAGAIVSLLTVHAGAATKVYRIGVLDADITGDWIEDWNEFVRELARLGFVEGKKIGFERRFGDESQPEVIRKNAAELVALKVDLIYAARGTLTALAAKNATKSIPIVFFSSADPVGLGLVPSLSRPIGNVTGNSISSFDFFRRTCSTSPRLRASSSASWRSFLRARSCCHGFPRWMRQFRPPLSGSASDSSTWRSNPSKRWKGGEETESRGYRRRGDRQRAGLVKAHQKRIAALLISLRIPSLGEPEDGFLLQYGIDGSYLARKAAGYVARILNGTKPSELPVEQVSQFNLVVNQKTAEAIGLKIPESMLLRASKVIR